MKKRIITAILSILMFVLMVPETVYAEVPYKTYTVDGYGYVTETQTAYTPLGSITKAGDISFQNPVDMMIAEDGLIYIADSLAGVILVCDLDGEYVRTIGEGILTNPTGVYVTENNFVYVADKGAKKVVVFDENGEVSAEYGKPDSIIYGDKLDFKPMKIAVNKSGSMYIICEGNTNGIVQISPVDGGSFLGYFGTNYTSLNPFQILQRMILTDAQRARMLSNIPSTPTNLTIDDDGLIYTVTQGDGLHSLKKLNIAGNNLIEPDTSDELPAAVATGNYENIFVASNDGYIYEYNSDGELLFVFGGRDDGRYRIGLCSKVEAVDVDVNDHLYVLDSEKKQIHIFEPTEFTNLLHQALYLYSKGRYTESKEPLTQVLSMNSLFDYANKAMGRAYLQEENYTEALKYAKLAKDYDGYSDSFWEVRNVWIRKNVVTAAIVIIAVVLAIKLVQYFLAKKKWGKKESGALKQFFNTIFMQRIRYGGYFMKHPIDGCYGVRREGKASYLCANLMLAAYILLTIITKYFSGFLFKNVREGRYDLISDIGTVLIVFFALTACNYLVVTINDGEGRLKELYCAYAYSLMPYIMIQPFLIIISNVLTDNEQFLIQFGNTFIKTWMVILLFLSMKEINNYTVKETIKIILLTAFTVLIAALLVFILYVLFSQVSDFVITLGREAVYRIGS
ncbi:MAG: hypothetical protein E7256_10230 [Lachnospiraceae bacterium]|nr:hypothetical protein [Lachnospiraceae bacterium]